MSTEISLHDHFRDWGAKCRAEGDFLSSIEGVDVARSLGHACPNCDEDRWLVVPIPDDDEMTAAHYCKCCGFMWPVWS